MSKTLTYEQRLEALAEKIYPIEAGMCLNRRQQARTNRVVWVRRTLRELNHLGDNIKNTVLDELESKART
jgi:hypothetical protein